MSSDEDEQRQDFVDPLLRAHIQQLCSALGGSHASEAGQYVLGDEALACLKDLKRWLKGYDEKLNRLDVARCMAECRLVTGDLLEIIASWSKEEVEDKVKAKIVLACVELLVPLTWPLDKDPAKLTLNHHKHMAVLEYAQAAYKNALLHYRSGAILKGVVRVCLPSIALSPKERTERDEGIIKLVLYLFRNIALIEHPNPSETGTGEEISLDVTIETFHSQNIFDFLLTISSGMGDDFKYQDTVVMETLYHLLKGVNIGKLFMTDKVQSAKAISQLETLLSMEKDLKVNNARSQSTRHSRFGTTVWVQKADGRRVTVSGQDVLADKSKGLEKADNSKRWKKPTRREKGDGSTANDFDMTVTLKGSSKRILRNFVELFLDAGFNPLFGYLRKAIERESDRILQNLHPRQFLYLVSWFLGAERMRRKVTPVEATEDGDLSFGLVAAVLNQETIILLKSRLKEWFDAKQWIDLEAGMRCMIQLLLTVQDMALSSLEEDQEIAENMQNRIFYEEDTLDMVLSLLRNYKAQSFGYLDACTELAHVQLRILERYSKQNTYIFVKAKRQKTRLKATQKFGEEATVINESDEELEVENRRNVRERSFDFIRYESKFLSNACVDTFLKLLAYYKELEYVQIKRALSFLHRVFVKREQETALFRLDVLDLLNRIVQGKDGLTRSHPAFKEVDQFTKHYIKQLVRKLQKTPALYVELLFTKTSRSSFFIQHGHNQENTVKKPRQPAELDVSPRLSYSEQVGVAVSVLLNENKDDSVDWLKGVVIRAVDERQAWESEQTARRMEEVTLQGCKGAQPESPMADPIVVTPDTEERKTLVSKDPKLMLLLRILGLKEFSLDDNSVINWEIPPSLFAADLRERLALLKKHTDEPPVYENGKIAEDFLRRKPKPRAGRLESSDEDGKNDRGSIDSEPQFGPNLLKVSRPKKNKKLLCRHRRGDAEEDPGTLRKRQEEAVRKFEARRKKQEEKMASIRSEIYIRDSDDEENEERDRVFFERERELEKKRKKLVPADRKSVV